MKITDADTIKKDESDFIDGLIGELDWQAIEILLKEKYRLKLHDDVEYKRGDIIVHGKAIAYKLDFDVRVTLSLVVGRDGECVDIRASGSGGDGDESDEFPYETGGKNNADSHGDDYGKRLANDGRDRTEYIRKKEAMASHLASIIDEINN